MLPEAPILSIEGIVAAFRGDDCTPEFVDWILCFQLRLLGAVIVIGEFVVQVCFLSRSASVAIDGVQIGDVVVPGELRADWVAGKPVVIPQV